MIKIRLLELRDRVHYLDLLKNLTEVGEILEAEFEERFYYHKFMNRIPVYEIYVMHDTDQDKIIGAATLLIEYKFIHQLGKVGHIEDVVIDPEYQKRGLGKKIIQHLVQRASALNCYKVILDCSDEVVAFYQKSGFQLKGRLMRYDI